MKTFLVNSLTVGSLMLGAFFFGVWYADNKNGVNVSDSPRPDEVMRPYWTEPIMESGAPAIYRDFGIVKRLVPDSVRINLFPLTHAQCDSIFKCQKQYRSSK